MTVFTEYRSGLNNVGSYQTSGIPFVTSSLSVTGSVPLTVSFPRISKFISIRNETPTGSTNVPLRIGFSEEGVQGTNYISLDNKETITRDWRASAVLLFCPTGEATASVNAGLTTIDANDLPSNWSGSVGI